MRLSAPENDPNYPITFCQEYKMTDTTLIERMHLKYLGGIYLDVFPLDGVPQSNLKQRIHLPGMNLQAGVSILSTATLINMEKVPAHGCRCCAGDFLLLPAYRGVSEM